jgi:hypothetical protein
MLSMSFGKLAVGTGERSVWMLQGKRRIETEAAPDVSVGRVSGREGRPKTMITPAGFA